MWAPGLLGGLRGWLLRAFLMGRDVKGRLAVRGGRTRGVLSGALDGLKRRDVLLCSVCVCVRAYVL